MKDTYINVCVTGAGNGIGRSIAIALNNRGYNVACADKDSKSLDETLDLMPKEKPKKIKIKIFLFLLLEKIFLIFDNIIFIKNKDCACNYIRN